MDIFYIIAGASVGFVIGVTGVGGGSLMTPLLVLGFNVQPIIAVGTDLLYAAITKASGVYSHHKIKNIDWSIVRNLSLGSIPGSIICLIAINILDISGESFNQLISVTLGIMLIATSAVIVFKTQLLRLTNKNKTLEPTKGLIICIGAVLGVLVTLSSVGAGAIGAALLLILYPSLKTKQVVGTDLAHAVPLTAIAGFGHFQLGHIDVQLLYSLLIGSLPAIYFGTKVGQKIPENVLKVLVASILAILGIKLSCFA